LIGVVIASINDPSSKKIAHSSAVEVQGCSNLFYIKNDQAARQDSGGFNEPEGTVRPDFYCACYLRKSMDSRS
jgi:hypothetical protein